MYNTGKHTYPHIHIKETASTNSYLQDLCVKESLAPFTTVTADFQTSGRGQMGNNWESEAGANLLFSFVMFPYELEVKQQFILSEIVSLAIKESLSLFDDGFSIKWPNDIYWQEKKICGILIENYLSGYYIQRSIVGVGLNVNQEKFQGNAPNPVSLTQITGKKHSKQLILDQIMERVQTMYSMLTQGKHKIIKDQYLQSLFRKEGTHLFKDKQGKVFPARIGGVEADGKLTLINEFEIKTTYMFKEIEYILTDTVIK